MSVDSSNPTQPSRQLPAWLVACSVLLGVVCLFFLSQAVGGLLLGIYGATQGWNQAQLERWLTNSIPAQFFYGVLAEGFMVAGVGLGLYWLHWTWSSIGLKKPKLRQLLLGLIAAVPYYVLFIIIVLVVSALVPELNTDQKQELGFEGAHGIVELTMVFIGLVVMPALAEEIAVRGLLYTGLKKWLPTVVSGLVVSVLFGLAHLSEGGASGPLWIGAIDTFTLSLVLVFLREKTGNLWAGIVLHAVKNTVAFATIFFIR